MTKKQEDKVARRFQYPEVNTSQIIPGIRMPSLSLGVPKPPDIPTTVIPSMSGDYYRD
jgi:hypothetical protein